MIYTKPFMVNEFTSSRHKENPGLAFAPVEALFDLSLSHCADALAALLPDISDKPSYHSLDIEEGMSNSRRTPDTL